MYILFFKLSVIVLVTLVAMCIKFKLKYELTFSARTVLMHMLSRRYIYMLIR